MSTQLNVVTRLFAIAVLSAHASDADSAATQNRPTLELFPMQVLENLQQTARSAQSLEQSLEGVFQDLDLQYQVYEASRCQGALDDPGCQSIERGLRQSYQQLLDQMLKELPEMERLVESTRRNLANSLRSQVGTNLSAMDLQRQLNQRPGTESTIRQENGPRVGRLSQQFQRYYEVVSRSRGSESMATMAADIYLDSREALEWIRLARQDMVSARTELEISLTWDGMSPQVMQTVGQVKALLFGEPVVLPNSPNDGTAMADANIRALELN